MERERVADYLADEPIIHSGHLHLVHPIRAERS